MPTFLKLKTQKIQVQFVLSLQKMKINTPQYITDYCRPTLIKKLIDLAMFCKLLHVSSFYILNIFLKN